MRRKHTNDYNHGKDGWVGGNPRYGRNRGYRRGDAPKAKALARRETEASLEDIRFLVVGENNYQFTKPGQWPK